MRNLVLATSLVLAAAAAAAQPVVVPQIESGFTIRSEPSVMLLRESPAAKAVLLFIPGGNGRLGYTPDMKFDPAAEPRLSFSKMLRDLAVPGKTSGIVHVAVLDSPYELPMGPDQRIRASSDHMVRIESAMLYLRDKYKLPIFIMGHSNGGYSLAEFLTRMQDKKKEDQLAGIVFSSGRIISPLPSKANVPALFISAEKDGCASTEHAGNRRLFEKFSNGNSRPTDFYAVKGGEPQGDPCVSGTHMYNAANEEAAKAIDLFLVKTLGTN